MACQKNYFRSPTNAIIICKQHYACNCLETTEKKCCLDADSDIEARRTVKGKEIVILPRFGVVGVNSEEMQRKKITIAN